MRAKILVALAIAAMTAAGCSKSDTLGTSLPYVPSDEAISFSDLPDGWSRGVVYDKANNNFTEMELYAFYTAQKSWAEVTSSDQMSNFMFDQSVDKSELDNSWNYSPLKYWPNNTGDKITFFALSPRDEIETSIAATTGKPIFSYTTEPFAKYNNDLMVDVKYDKQKDASGVEFEMQHALTRINISARVINGATSDLDGENIHYTVNGVMFYDIMSQGNMTINASNEVEWVNQKSPIDLAVTHGYTLLDAKNSASAIPFDDDDSGLSTDYRDVCADGQAIFVMPQPIEASTASDRPMVELRIRKSYTFKDQDGNDQQGELIFIPEKVEIPTPNKAEWTPGDWINLQFTFDASEDCEMPLTVRSEIYDYTDVDVDITVHKSLYIYSNRDDVIEVASSATTADMMFYTNYEENLTGYHDKIDLDGSKRISYGFVFYTNDTDFIIPEHIGTADDGGEKYRVKVSDSYEFTYSVKQQTRGELGLYDDSDSGIGDDSGAGASMTKDDYVYTLTMDINEDHLTKYDESGNVIGAISTLTPAYGLVNGVIGAQMLSDAGGMIVKKFPITLKKDL